MGIQDIELTLKRWGLWARQDTKLGIKALSIYDSPAPATERAGMLATLRAQARVVYPMSDDEALAFDQALISLKAWKPELFELLKSVYLDNLPLREVGKRLGQDHSALARKTTVAKGYLCGYFDAARVKTVDC